MKTVQNVITANFYDFLPFATYSIFCADVEHHSTVITEIPTKMTTEKHTHTVRWFRTLMDENSSAHKNKRI